MALGWSCFLTNALSCPTRISRSPTARSRRGARANRPIFCRRLRPSRKHYDFKQSTKWKDLPKKVQQVFLYGSGEEEIQFRYDEGGRVYQVTRVFEGVIPNMERRYRETDSNWIREEFERYQNNRSCGTCHGYRLRPEALAVKIAGLHAGEVVQMSIRDAFDWCETVPDASERTEK